jgi:hypothetical protein
MSADNINQLRERCSACGTARARHSVCGGCGELVHETSGTESSSCLACTPSGEMLAGMSRPTTPDGSEPVV